MLGIVGALAEEIVELRDSLEGLTNDIVSGIRFTRGSVDGVPVVVVKCGIGKVNAAICSQILLTKYDVDAMLFTGVAGGLRPSLVVGDFVVSTGTVQHDLDLTVFGRLPGEAPSPQTVTGTHALRRSGPATVAVAPADEDMIRAVERAFARLPPELKGTRVLYRGLVASGDTFVSFEEVGQVPSNTEESARAAYARYVLGRLVHSLAADCVEMEGAALGHVCMLANRPFVVVRCISDLAGGTAPGDFDGFVQVISPVLTALTRAVVRELQ